MNFTDSSVDSSPSVFEESEDVFIRRCEEECVLGKKELCDSVFCDPNDDNILLLLFSENAALVLSVCFGLVVVEGKILSLLGTTAVEGVTIVSLLPLFGKTLVTSSLSILEEKVIEELFMPFKFLNKFGFLCFRTTL